MMNQAMDISSILVRDSNGNAGIFYGKKMASSPAVFQGGDQQQVEIELTQKSAHSKVSS